MNRKKIYIIIVAVAVIFVEVVAFLIFSNFMESRSANISALTSKNVDISKIPEMALTTLTQDQALVLAQKIKSPEPCFKIADSDKADLCVKLIAQYLQSSKSCAYITDKTAATVCSDRANFAKAVKDNSINLCLSIVDDSLHQACVQKIVDSKQLKQNDCNRLPDKEKKYCLNYIVYLNDATIFSSAKSKDDCQKIADKTTKQFCLEKF
jgi:hypothetical protein